VTASLGPQTVEAGDRSSEEAREFCQQWQAEHPDHAWVRAELDRQTGLTLYSEQFTLHLKNANCGYRGEGPIDTVRMLEVTGFGHNFELYASLEDQVFSPAERHVFRPC
jgi:hypothetical protein